MIAETAQLIEHTVHRVVIVGGEEHGPFIKKGCDDRIDDRPGLSGAWGTLDVGQGIFHGIVDRQELV